ncbi:MAG: GNAT family N-acetyltransferase [Pirellulales bacterium]
MERKAARVICSLPRRFVAKSGQSVRFSLLSRAADERLVAMYLAFRPRNSFQGLPPLKDEVCVKWVREMISTGINFVAHSADESIVGHSAIFPVNDRKCEMLVVTSPGFQNLGIGTELVRCCIEGAGEMGFERIWLPVDATNVRARHVYKKCGFEYVSDRPSRELDMVFKIQPRIAPGAGGAAPAPAHQIMPHFLPGTAYCLGSAETGIVVSRPS